VDGATLEDRLGQLMDELAAGPSSAELEEELSTALPPDVRLSVTDVEGGTATIDISGGEDSPAGLESRRAVGQIVLTASSLPGIGASLLTRDGAAVEAPLPSGQLTSAPLEAEDYAALLTPPPP
jgi:spore germination protein GerM